MKLKPSTKRFLRTLKNAGPQGLHSFQFREPEYGSHVDAPKRCSEARAAGYEIEIRSERWRGHQGKRYIFRSSPPGQLADREEGDRGSGTATPAAVPSSITGDTTGAESLPNGHLFDLEDFKARPGHDREAA